MSSLFLHASIAWAALALIAVPIIIHLIHRRRFIQLDWAAMEFLLEALKRARRRLRLEQLLLLLVRIAMVVFLGFAIARPIASEAGLSWLASFLGSEEQFVILDDSFSMSRQEGGRSIFARALDAVRGQLRRIAERPSAGRMTILRASKPRVPLSSTAFLSREQLLELELSVARLSPTDTRMPLAQVLEELAAKSAGGPSEEKPRARTISIVTDFRAADWTAPGGGPDGELREALSRLSEENGTRIVVLDVGSEDTSNVAILEASLEGGKAIQDVPAEIRVAVKNFGHSAVRGLSLRVRYAPAPVVSGEDANFATTLAPPLGDLGPGETKTSTISCTFHTAGHYGALVELMGPPDPLPGDDAIPLAIEVVPATEVLVVSGEPSSERFEGESDFLSEALSPEGAVSGIRANVVSDENLPRGELDQYAVVFLLNVHSVPDEFLSPLASYVRRGGTLAIFLGDQVDAALYNRRLGPGSPEGKPAGGEAGAAVAPKAEAEGAGLLPARLGNVISARENPPGIVFDLDHPYFQFLRDLEDWVAMVRFERYFELEPLQGARTVARFRDANRSPAVVEGSAGRGKTILFASAADLEWNDWPRNPSYLMALQKLVTDAARSRAEVPHPLAGVPLVIPVDIARYATEARLRPPGFPGKAERSLLASPQSASGDEEFLSFLFTIEDLVEAGLYALQLKSASGAPEWRQIAVRRDPRESDPSRMSLARLSELYPEAEITLVRDPAALARAGSRIFEASDVLLWAFVVLLFIECLLARIFAHHAGQGASAAARGGTA